MPFSTNQYISAVSGTTGTNDLTQYISFETSNSRIEKKANQISPQLYFKYVKNKLGTLQKLTLERRLKRLTKAFDEVVKNDQEALGMKLIREIDREVRESQIYARGFKHFIEAGDINRYRNQLTTGKISDTKFKDFTRIIPKDVLEKKKKVEDLFDGFVIFHYWNEAAETKRQKKQKADPEETQRMRDPILFGVIKESDRFYFIADWEDEHCDLTFDQMVDFLGKDESEVTLSREPKIRL